MFVISAIKKRNKRTLLRRNLKPRSDQAFLILPSSQARAAWRLDVLFSEAAEQLVCVLVQTDTTAELISDWEAQVEKAALSRMISYQCSHCVTQ